MEDSEEAVAVRTVEGRVRTTARGRARQTRAEGANDPARILRTEEKGVSRGVQCVVVGFREREEGERGLAALARWHWDFVDRPQIERHFFGVWRCAVCVWITHQRRADAPRRPSVPSAAAPLAARVMAKGPHSSPGGYSRYSNTPKKSGPPSDHSGYSSEDDFEGPTLFGSILRTIMAGGAVVAIAILVRPRDATRA